MYELEALAALFLCITNLIQLLETREMKRKGKEELKKIAQMLMDYVNTK